MALARDVSSPALPAAETPPEPLRERRPLRDNPRLILLGIALLIAALVAMMYLADQSTQFTPDFLTESLLWALSAADITMLLALVFVLARNIIKLVVERRRGLPFSRFRAKLVLAMLGLTIIPSVLVLIVGGELIRQTTARWFAAPIEEVLRSATGDCRRLLRRASDGRAGACRANCTPALRSRAAVGRRRIVAGGDRGGRPPGARRARRGLSREEQRATDAGGRGRVAVTPDGGTHGPRRTCSPRGSPPAAATAPRTMRSTSGGELVRAGVIVPDPSSGAPIGVVIASDYLAGSMAQHSRRITEAYEGYSRCSSSSRRSRASTCPSS